jgi:hypothetical protein
MRACAHLLCTTGICRLCLHRRQPLPQLRGDSLLVLSPATHRHTRRYRPCTRRSVLHAACMTHTTTPLRHSPPHRLPAARTFTQGFAVDRCGAKEREGWRRGDATNDPLSSPSFLLSGPEKPSPEYNPPSLKDLGGLGAIQSQISARVRALYSSTTHFTWASCTALLVQDRGFQTLTAGAHLQGLAEQRALAFVRGLLLLELLHRASRTLRAAVQRLQPAVHLKLVPAPCAAQVSSEPGTTRADDTARIHRLPVVARRLRRSAASVGCTVNRAVEGSAQRTRGARTKARSSSSSSRYSLSLSRTVSGTSCRIVVAPERKHYTVATRPRACASGRALRESSAMALEG